MKDKAGGWKGSQAWRSRVSGSEKEKALEQRSRRKMHGVFVDI